MTLAVAGGRRRGGCRPPQPPGGRTKQLRRFQVAVFAPISGPKFESARVSAVTASPDTRSGNLKVRPESHGGGPLVGPHSLRARSHGRVADAPTVSASRCKMWAVARRGAARRDAGHLEPDSSWVPGDRPGPSRGLESESSERLAARCRNRHWPEYQACCCSGCGGRTHGALLLSGCRDWRRWPAGKGSGRIRAWPQRARPAHSCGNTGKATDGPAAAEVGRAARRIRANATWNTRRGFNYVREKAESRAPGAPSAPLLPSREARSGPR